MTTLATKPVRRKWPDPLCHVTRRTNASVFSAGARRPVIVTIYPDGLIGLRLHKQRREEVLCADMAYKQAVVERQAYERAQKRKAKRGKA